MKEERVNIRQALYASKIVSYAQGFMLMREEAKQQGWNLNFGGVALMWRGGCIIRSRFLGNIKEAFEKDPNLNSLLLDDFFKNAIHASPPHLHSMMDTDLLVSQLTCSKHSATTSVPTLTSASTVTSGHTLTGLEPVAPPLAQHTMHKYCSHAMF